MLRRPNLALSNGELVEKERPQEGHCLFALLAVPECAHVRFALPQRDGVARVWIALIAREPLVLESFHIAPHGCGLLVRRLKAIPLAGDDPTPNDTHIHFRLLGFLRLPVSRPRRLRHLSPA